MTFKQGTYIVFASSDAALCYFTARGRNLTLLRCKPCDVVTRSVELTEEGPAE